MEYNKKQILPLVKKFNINMTTNKSFNKILKMFDGKPNYQSWAVKMFFSRNITMNGLENVLEWVNNNKNLINNLEKKTITAYTTKESIKNLFVEMKSLEKVSIIKGFISRFNTDQRKILRENIDFLDVSGIDAFLNPNLNTWFDIVVKFNRLPEKRQFNFITKCSSVRNFDTLKEIIVDAVEGRYDWDKEDMLAYMHNNANGCKIVYDNGPYLITTVPTYKAARKMAGGGRTQWCIATSPNQWDDYVKFYVDDYGNPTRTQYFIYDFTRRETDPFAHIGFTIEKGYGIVEAQSGDNEPMMEGHSNGVEKLSIYEALDKIGAHMSIFMQIKGNKYFDWNADSLKKYIDLYEDVEKCKVCYDKNNIIILKIDDHESLLSLIENTLIPISAYYIENDRYSVFLLFDFNRPIGDRKSMFSMYYAKNQYGDLSLMNIHSTYGEHFEKIKVIDEIFGITEDDFMPKNDISPSILLHKYIDEDEEEMAIKLIHDAYDNIDVNYNFNMRVASFSAIIHSMYKLFDVIVKHPTFNHDIEDGFGQTILEHLIFAYVSCYESERQEIEKMINSVIEIKDYHFNSVDINGDTALMNACLYSQTSWVAKKLISNSKVDVNVTNDLNQTALTLSITRGNLDVIEALSKRKDIIVTENEIELAGTYGVNLNKYFPDIVDKINK